MSPSSDLLQESKDFVHEIANVPAVALNDSRVIRAVEEYLACLETGPAPDRQEFLARYPEIATALAKCLDGLEFVHGVAPQLSGASPGQLLSAAPEFQSEVSLGDFRILREIGRGGMGVVYEAQQISLKRRVALKVLPFAAVLDPRQLQRFQNEAQTAACLHHTNIVPVFTVGCERGVHYFAMQYIDGETLDRVIQNLRRQQRLHSAAKEEGPRNQPTTAHSPAPPTSAPPSAETVQPVQASLSTERSIASREFFQSVARLGIQAAEGLDHAHQQGILHRDIKPANLLLDLRGNLWITDFGLARFQKDARLSMTGDLVGTLRYMSPEQALAKRVVVDHRTDIYSLGVTLYELLTLEPAFRGSDREELLRQVAFEEPRSPRRLNKSIPAELETIVLKATEKNPAERYATAQELADDLRRFVEDKPIRAKRPTLVQRAAKWRRRHPAVVWSTLVITLILVASLGWIVRDWQVRRTEAEAQVVEALEVAEPRLLQGNPYDRELVSAARRAEAQLAGGVVREQLRHQVVQLLADMKMLEKLEEIGLMRMKIADTAYAEAFREYGIDVEALSVQDAAERIRQRAIGLPLAIALDDWALIRAGGTNWKPLLEVAREVDPDPWRCAIREARVSGKKEDLKRLVASEPISKLPATTLSELALLFGKEGGSTAQLIVAALREGQHRSPADYGVNFQLAWFLAEEMKPPQLDEAIGFYRAALALRPQSYGIRLNLSKILHENNRLDEDILYCKEAIDLIPDASGAYQNLAIALHGKGRVDEAIACYRKAIHYGKQQDPDLHYMLGGPLADKGQLDEAIVAYKEAIRLRPDFPAACTNLGSALIKKGAVDEAIAYLKQAIALKPNGPIAHSNLGDALRRKGQLDEAIAHCREAIRLDKDFALAHSNLGVALRDKGQLDEAIAEFREAIKLKPDDAEAYGLLGKALHDKGQPDEAITCLRKAVTLNKDGPAAYNDLGAALRFKGHSDEAIACYQKAIRLKPDLAVPHSNLGLTLRDKGQLDEAIAEFRKAIELKPDVAEAYGLLGKALHDKGQPDEAITCFRKAVTLDKDSPGAHIDLGTALDYNGQSDEAIACYQKAIHLKPDFAMAHSNLGCSLYHQGRWAEADAAFRDALRLDPNAPFSNGDLGWFRANCPDVRFRNIQEAVQLAKKATELQPGKGEHWLALGVAHYRAGQFQEAIADLQKPKQLRARETTTSWLFLAMAHWQLGDKEQARKLYNQASDWLEKNQPENVEELRRFRAEAAALLEIEELPKPQEVQGMPKKP
jgi:tetratricopeptide (TPR) repeat protein